MKLEHTLRQAMTNRRAHSEVHYSTNGLPAQHSLGDINSVRRELLAVCAQVGGREAQTASEMFPLLHRPQDRVIAPEHALCRLEIPQFYCLPNRRAAHDHPVDRKSTRLNSSHLGISY